MWLAGVAFGAAIATKNQAAMIGPLAQVGYILVARDFRPLRQWRWAAAHLLGLFDRLDDDPIRQRLDPGSSLRSHQAFLLLKKAHGG